MKWVLDVDKALYEARTTVQLILNDGKAEGAAQTSDSDKITLSETVFLTIKDGKPALLVAEDGGDDEEDPAETWGIIGLGGNWDDDKVMTLEGEFWTAKGVAIATTDQFKFRTVGKWSQDGGQERTSSGEAKIDKENAAITGYGNITVGTAGTYDIYLSKTLDKFYIMTAGKTPADAGITEKTTITVYSDVQKTYIYGWWEDDYSYFTDAWPGSANEGTETISGTVYYKWTLSIDKEKFDAGVKTKIILSNGDDATKTNDSAEITLTDKLYLTIDGSNTPVVKTVVDDGNGDNENDENQGDGEEGDDDQNNGESSEYVVTVYGTGTENYDYLYSWSIKTGDYIFGTWPGTKATAVNETINGITYKKKWQVTLSKEVYEEGGAQFIMNNNSGSQTDNSCIISFGEDILLSQKKDGDTKYIVWDNRPADNGTTEVSVYCKTDFTHLYGWWSDGSRVSKDWPGTESAATETIDGVTYKKWTFSVSTARMGYDRARFILNNGNGGANNQTQDSDFIEIKTETIITAPALKTE